LTTAVLAIADSRALGGTLRLIVTSDSAPDPVRPLVVHVRFPAGQVPSQIAVSFEDAELPVPVVSLGDGVGEMLIPLSPQCTRSLATIQEGTR